MRLRKLKYRKNMYWSYWSLFVKTIVPVLLLIFFPLLPLFFLTKIESHYLYMGLMPNKYYRVVLESVMRRMDVSLSFILGILIFVSLMYFIRKNNKDAIYNGKGTIYYEYPYIFFWINSKILGYNKIQLAGIPIYLQFKLVLNNTFHTIIPDAGKQFQEEETTTETLCENFNQSTSTLNLILEDTYQISLQSLPDELRGLPRITVRTSQDIQGKRYKNPEFISEIRKIVSKYNTKYETVNIFSTANPANNIEIINSSFRQFGRIGFKKVYVYQMDTPSCKYIKHHRIL
ncbi:MAG: hypothetical protein ABF969_03335 [Sporolactobacillus sp.]